MYYGLGAGIARVEHAGLTRVQVREMVAPVREIFARSPFVRRAQLWPRGYPGDFETIEQLVSQANRAPERTLAWLIESYCLGSPFAQQHRNKVAHQAGLITEAILRPGPGPRVLIIAARAAPDLRLVPPQIIGHGCRFVLNDHDQAALHLAKNLLGPVARSCAIIPGNILRVRHGGHRAGAARTSWEPVRTHGGGFMWAVAWVVACGAHPCHRPRWNRPRRASRPAPGLVCAAATKERSNRR